MTASFRAATALLVSVVLIAAAACSRSSVDDTATVGSAITVATAPMTMPHARGAGARLADGRAIVTGGWSPAATQLDIFDPAVGTWSAGPQLPSSHEDHAAFALPDGRIALAGGTGDGVDVYNPSGAWTHIDDQFRQYSAAALLAEGHVLVAGGWDGVSSALASAVLVDPVQGTIQPTGALAIARSGHRAVLLADGRVLVLGGTNQAGTALTSVEAFDPQTGEFSAVAPMLTGRQMPTATRLLDGRVLVAGGWNVSAIASAEVYDPATDAWTAVGPMHHARQLHEAILLPGGLVAVLGGLDSNYSSTADVELFDPATGVFGLADPLTKPRYYESAVLLSTGRVLVAGGNVPGEGSGTATAEILDFGACTPTTCAATGKTCGTIADGCGGTLECGTCAQGENCVANICTSCAPATCASLGATCGQASDGCGGTLECGACGVGQDCVANACVCVPTTCAAQYKTCGTIPDGCGGTLDCGACGVGSTCGPNNVCVAADGATYDSTYHAPRCTAGGTACSSGTLLVGRAALGPEANAPNTIDGCADGASGSFHSDESLDALRVSTVDGSPLAAGAMIRIEADVWAYSSYTSDALDLYIAANADSPAWTKIATVIPTKVGAQTLSTTTTLPRGGSVQAVRGVFRYSGSAAPCTTGSYDDHDDLLFAVEQPPDTVPPTVALTSPTATYLTGSVLLQASASDDAGVVRVAFLDGGTVIANAFSAPWSASWNTTVYANGARTLTAVAYDAAGNTASASRQVIIDNAAPTATLTSPAAGAVLSGTVTLLATALDNEVVARVEFYDGTALIGASTSAPWTTTWNTTIATNGAHTLSARAYDAAGNAGASAGVAVTLSNAGAPAGAATYDATRLVPVCASVGASCDTGTLLNGRASLGPEAHAPNALRGSCSDGTFGTYHVDESLDRLKVMTLDGGPLAAGKTVRVEATVWVWGASSDRLDLYYAANADAPAWTLVGTLAPTATGLQTLTSTYVLPVGGLQAIRGMYRYGGSPGPCVSGSYNDVDDLVFATH